MDTKILQRVLENSIKRRIYSKLYQDLRRKAYNITEETEPDMTKKKMKVKK